MAEGVITLRELNRATLARQLPLERKRLSPPGDRTLRAHAAL